MKYTTIAGKKLSQMSLGTVQLGMNYGIANGNIQPDINQSFNMLHTALEQGVTSLDTARRYGNAEDVLGKFFSKYEGELPFVTTKLWISMPADASEREVEQKMIESIETSLSKLNLKKVNCILLHDAIDMTKHGNIVTKTLEAFVKKGYTDVVGASVYTAEELDTMLQYDVFQATQIPLNIFDQQLIIKGYMHRLKANNILTFVRSVFLQGLFFLNPDNITDFELKKYTKEPIIKLIHFAREESMSIAELAISYIRDIPGVTSLVLGADTAEQVMENTQYMNAPKIGTKTRALIEQGFNGVNITEIMKVLRKPKK